MSRLSPLLLKDLLILIENLNVLINQLAFFYQSTKLSSAQVLYRKAFVTGNVVIRGIKQIVPYASAFGIKPTINSKFIDRSTWSKNFLELRFQLVGIAQSAGVKPAEVAKTLVGVDLWYNINIKPYIEIKK